MTPSPLPLKKEELFLLSNRDIENYVDKGLRHKSGVKSVEYLNHWLSVGRAFGYATRDDSWGEFEKCFAIMTRRLIVAERTVAAIEPVIDSQGAVIAEAHATIAHLQSAVGVLSDRLQIIKASAGHQKDNHNADHIYALATEVLTNLPAAATAHATERAEMVKRIRELEDQLARMTLLRDSAAEQFDRHVLWASDEAAKLEAQVSALTKNQLPQGCVAVCSKCKEQSPIEKCPHNNFMENDWLVRCPVFKPPKPSSGG